MTPLTVDIQVEGDQVQLSFRDARTEIASRTASLAALQGLGLAEVLRLDPSDLERSLPLQEALRRGEGLARWLFGDEAEVRSIFGAVFPRIPGVDPGPLAGAARMVLRVRSPELQAQPWHLLCWRGRPLVAQAGWEIATQDPGRPTGMQERVAWPPRILLFAPAVDPRLKTSAHLAAIKGRLESVHPALGTSDCFVHLRSLPELRRALQVPGDILFYYYGHGASGSIQSYGEEGESWIPVLELARILPEDRVKLVFLNTCMGGEGGWLSSLWQLSAVSPIVLSHHTSVLRDVAQERALSVWTAIFRGTHPTTAFCDIPPSSPIQSSEWWCGAVVDQTSSWTVDAPARAAHLHDPLWAWRLDRTQQRDFLLGRLREMVNTGRPSRSQVFLIYGPPRNHIDMFASSLEDRLLAEVESACIRRYRMDLPPPAQIAQHDAWDQCLRAALGVGAELPLSDALVRLEGELRPEPGERALLWLQVEATPRTRYPEEKGVRAAVEGALTALSRWRSELPKYLRIAMLLPMEVPEENLAKVESWGHGLELDHSSPEAGCYLVNPPLSAVSVRDLYLFLAHHQDAERSDQVQRELARAIHERCQGSYAGAVELLQRGTRIGFAALREDLRPQAPKGDDF